MMENMDTSTSEVKSEKEKANTPPPPATKTEKDDEGQMDVTVDVSNMSLKTEDDASIDSQNQSIDDGIEMEDVSKLEVKQTMPASSETKAPDISTTEGKIQESSSEAIKQPVRPIEIKVLEMKPAVSVQSSQPVDVKLAEIKTETPTSTTSSSVATPTSTTPITTATATGTGTSTVTNTTLVNGSEKKDKIEKPAAPKPLPKLPEEESKWHTVGIYHGTTCTVTNFIDNKSWHSYGNPLRSNDLPDLSDYKRIPLEPGGAYRFRLRAINTVGTGDWSEVSNFKTCLPGFPGAPSAIKISKSGEGAHLTWEPPPSCINTNEIIEYSVYLAVKPTKDKDGKSPPARPQAQLAFVRVYVGSLNQCTVPQSSLSNAHVDCSTKPAIIFRIAARNEKGYGPATQVRWLQDTIQSAASANTNSLLSPNRNARNDANLPNNSPSKRFKPSVNA